MEYVYEGIVLTTIDAEDSPTEISPNRVTFSADTPKKRKDDTSAIFIHKVKDTGGENGELEAEKLTVEEVRDMINSESQDEAERSTDEKDKAAIRKILFTVHGFNGNARGYLLQVKGIAERFNKFKLIPVIWPSAGSALRYFSDRAFSKAAGEALQSIKSSTNSFSGSLLVHSMGNRVLRNFASGGYQFDNIFMVASDVDSRIFTENYINGGKEEWRKDGLEIKGMLSQDKGGKIHVLVNKKDPKLLQSSIINFRGRLGRSGPSSEDSCCCGKNEKIHDEIKDYLLAVDFTSNNLSDQHCYQFDWGTAAYCDTYYI